ncbi:hypothetical protein ALP94_02542 [Pseudomonas savastanoi pv. glycinea]|uniref:hypothetical protein n=1 Tax=Pseudomonas quasicaspiana TaxID=2829821 RepID=UPI000F010555|nr:hypothetical protein [Pseudomonas quasicaspiana]MCD5974957.1 hypothetical protein [Pseudomonas quasicaspiana]RMQ96013.1 hypothetical protein ALP94_02542 [Pseudomonas savastanoi pv. glycinea]
MDKMITADQLATTDLRTINEIWLSGSTELCLWRAEQVFTHDMLSEGTHDQNTSRLVVKMGDTEDQPTVSDIEATVRELLKNMGMEGHFFPAEQANTRG